MAGSAQVSVTSATAVLLAAAPATLTPGQAGWAFLSNSSSGAVYLGGPGVTTSNGASLAASATLNVPLFAGDQVYGIASSTTSVVGVLQTGA